MKHSILLFFFGFLFLVGVNLLWAGGAWAQAEPEAAVNQSSSASPQQIKVFAGLFDYAYSEPGVMSIEGTLFNMGVEYRRLATATNGNLWWGLNGALAVGQPTYDGAVVNLATNVRTPVKEKSTDLILDTEALLGLTFWPDNIVGFELSVGLGAWYLYNKIGGGGSYTRQTTYWTLPVGGKIILFNRRSVRAILSGQYNLLLRGRVQSRLSEASSSLQDSDNTQSEGYGTKLSAKLEWARPKGAIYFELHARTWDLERSDGAPQGNLVFYEPKNDTRTLGANVGWVF